MCGRFTQVDPGRIALEFTQTRLPAGVVVQPRYNLAPTQPALVVRVLDLARGAGVDLLRWGLVPGWATDPRIGERLINARVETAATKPSFRAALRKRRCLIGAEGFFEWQRDGKLRRPRYIRGAGGALLAMAGLWESWSAPGAEPLQTFTILTTQSLPPVAALHDRMPVFIDERDRAAWLDPRLSEPDALLARALGTLPPVEVVSVGTHVNSPRHDDPRCLEPVSEPAGLF